MQTSHSAQVRICDVYKIMYEIYILNLIKK